MKGAREVLARVRVPALQGSVLVLLLAVNGFAYWAGLTLWYGPVMGDPATPVWAWPFVPDCPLFALLGALALVMVAAQRHWSVQTQKRVQRWLVGAGAVALAVGLLTWWPGGWSAWRAYSGLWTLLGMSLLLCGGLLRRAPVWLLCLLAAGQIKYGIWTITAWALFWRNTAALFGSPMWTPDSILMTISHVGLAAQGVLLLTFIRPTLGGALAALGWFGLSDYVDYGLGWFPAVPQIIPISVLQWSTQAMTLLLGGGMAIAALRPPARSPLPQMGPPGPEQSI